MINKGDERLLAMLRQNARASVSELARSLDLSRSTVQSRLRRLEDQGVIRGYSVDLGERFLSDRVEAHVSIKVHQKLTARVNRALEEKAAVIQLYSVSGEYDLIAVVQCPSLEAMSQVLDDIGNLEGVERTNSAVVLETRFRR